MRLITEDAADVRAVTPSDIDTVLTPDAFGCYAILESASNDYVQIGNDWQPDDATRAFHAETGSDPWILEYKEPNTDCNQRSTKRITLDEARRIFKLFLDGDTRWKAEYNWEPFVWQVDRWR